MARTGRPANPLGPKVRFELYLEPILAAEVRLLITDPVRQKPKYGELNRIMEGLLRDWVNTQRKQRAQDVTERVLKDQEEQ